MPSPSNNSDEIKYSDFSKVFKSFTFSVFRITHFLNKCLLSRKPLILFIFIAGLFIGYFYFIQKTAGIEVRLLVKNTVLTRKTFSELIENFNNLTKDQRKRIAATTPIPSENTLDNILYVHAQMQNGTKVSEDTTSDSNVPFVIIVGLEKDKSAQDASNFVVNYINSNPYLLAQANLSLSSSKEILADIENDISKLDSLKTAYNRALSHSVNASYFRNETDPAEIYRASSELYFRRDMLKKKLTLENKPLVVIDQSQGISKKRSTSLIITLLTAFGLSLLISIFICAYLELSKRQS